jgi:ferredoxin-NADP reductase
VLRVPANHESAVITALILFFLFAPAFRLLDVHIVALATALGVASKYLIAPRKQHLLNPAAFGAACLSLTGYFEAWWWVAQPELFIPLVLVGSAVVAKVRRWPMVLALLITGAVVFLSEALLRGTSMDTALWRYTVTGPALFLACFMLTEPFTTPPTTKQQIGYGALVGALMSTSVFASFVAVSPELALLVGNLVFYPSMLKQKLYLKFKEKRELASETYEYDFEVPHGLFWKPGQYLEWMLPHETVDNRGSRRYFTIASAPEEGVVKLALRVVPAGGSSYKAALQEMKPGDALIASQRAGDFVLPKDPSVQIGMIAGGIGVTPFRAHIGHLLATEGKRDVTLYYCNKRAADIAYQDVFARAREAFGLQVVHVLEQEKVEGMEHGFVTVEMIKQHTPDYAERTWYLSGPPAMVHAYTKLLRTLKVPSRQIVTDFFPGLA